MARVSSILKDLSKIIANLFIVEFILSAIKVAGLVGFIILGVIIDCGGVGPQGYIGAKYWRTYISFWVRHSVPFEFQHVVGTIYDVELAFDVFEYGLPTLWLT